MKKVLIVDKEPALLEYLGALFRVYGLAVCTADNGKMAIQKIVENPDLDLILSDFELPHFDGRNFAKKILYQKPLMDESVLGILSNIPEERHTCC